MKIVLQPATGSPIIIASGNGSSGQANQSPIDFAQNGAGVLEVVARPRAAGVLVFDRKNVQNTITFEVHKAFGAAHGAELFCLMRASQVSLTGRFIFTTEGTSSSVAYMDGGIQNVATRHIGLLAFASYTLVGGRITT